MGAQKFYKEVSDLIVKQKHALGLFWESVSGLVL
jgi:hypothetical protein